MRRAAALALLALLAACGRGPDARGGLRRGETLVQVEASGRVDRRPDEARIGIGVETIAANAAAAGRGNAQAMARVMAAVRPLGIGEDDIRTTGVSLNRIDYGPNRGRFSASNQVELRVRRLDRAGEVIGASVAAGANVVSGPDFRLGDPERAAQAAYVAALRAARARADAYAAALEMKVVRIIAVRDGRAGAQPYPLARDGAYEVAPQAVSAPISPGLQTSEAQVRVDFALR